MSAALAKFLVATGSAKDRNERSLTPVMCPKHSEILTTARRLGFTGERNSPGRIDRAQIGCTLAVPFVRLSHKPDEPMLNPDQIFGQLRPILTLAGSILIAGGLLKFFGVNVPIHGSGLEIAVAGYLMKSI